MKLFKIPDKGAMLPPLEPHSTLHNILHNQAISAIILLVAAISAFILANIHIPLGDKTVSEWYAWLWHVELGFHVVNTDITQSLHVWVNDGLMAIFFLLVGLEIKRELIVGELASVRKAALPIAAAIGGMIFPAAIYAGMNWGGEGLAGWGIPMATDIAFAAGVIGLLSKRVPAALAVFLIALAIVDDLGAVLVIAIFYTDSINALSLEAGLAIIFFSFILARLGFRSTVMYTILAIFTWLAFLQSGVHATIAGVLFALTIPVDARYESPLFIKRIQKLLSRFDEVEDHVNPRLVNASQQRLLRAIELECIHVEAPLQRMENKLHPFIAFLIMPLFAFANSGVELDFSTVGQLVIEPVTLGVIFGLVFGKQLGIMVFSGLAVALKLAELPQGVKWKHIYGVSCLAGIGFTMSLFITQLAFAGGHGTPDAAHATAEAAHGAVSYAAGNVHLMEAKVGVLLASIISGVLGATVLYFSTGKLKQNV